MTGPRFSYLLIYFFILFIYLFIYSFFKYLFFFTKGEYQKELCYVTYLGSVHLDEVRYPALSWRKKQVGKKEVVPIWEKGKSFAGNTTRNSSTLGMCEGINSGRPCANFRHKG